MEINFDAIERNLIVKITGDIDHHTAEPIREKIEKEFKGVNAKNIIFDFSKVSFMDSSGIGMIIGRYKSIEKMGGKVVVCCMDGTIERLFTISGLHKIIACSTTIDEAVEAVK